MEKKSFFRKYAGVVFVCLMVVGFVSAYGYVNKLYGYEYADEVEVEGRSWQRVYPVWADPGAGNSGAIYGAVVPHAGDPGATYVNNVSWNSMYAVENTTNNHAGSDVPYAPTTFDIIYQYRLNRTDCFSDGNATWMISWCRSNLTSPYFSLTNESMLKYNITGGASGADYIWVYFVANNGGSGFTINRGDNVTQAKSFTDVYK